MSHRPDGFRPLKFFLCCLSFALFPVAVFAATLSVDPDHGSYAPGDTFVLTIRLDTHAEECINAARVELHYPTGAMKAGAVSKGESFFTLWTQEPLIDHERGIISFEGGIPAGYCGRIQGDPGKTNVLAKVVFSIPGNMIGGNIPSESDVLPVTFALSTQVLRNDGLGTPAVLETHGGRYTRLAESSGLKNEWLEMVHADTLPPEPFSLSIMRDDQVFGGKHFIIFSTIDKQSGIDHFEIMEDDPERPGFIQNKSKQALFVSATSPYLLTDQTLRSRITVRAFDHAGNTQEAIELPTGMATSTSSIMSEDGRWWVLVGILLAVAAFVSYRVFRLKAASKDGRMAPRDRGPS